MCKVHFTLHEGNFDEHTPPPHGGGESLWAELLSDETAKLRNIPFVIKGVSHLDQVKLKKYEPEPGQEDMEIGPNFFEFDKVIERSGHGTVRAISRSVKSEALVVALGKINELGCESESTRGYGIVAIDIPRHIDSGKVVALLEPLRLADEIYIDIGHLPT